MSACGWQASDFRAVLGRAPSNEFKERSQPCKVSSGCNRTRRSGAVLPRDLSPFDRLQFVGELADRIGDLVVDIGTPQRERHVRLDEAFRRPAIEGAATEVVTIERLLLL